IGRPIGDRFGTDPNRQASSLFERGVILAPIADAVRGFLFHRKKSLPRHFIRRSSLRFVQQSPTLLLENLSRTILAGSLTTQQEVGVILHVYFHALLRWGLWEEVISDHGGQFNSHDFQRVNQRLGIRHEMYEKGQPWRNLIESQFGIQARLG